MEELKTLYFEVVEFFQKCGGPYRNMADSSFFNIADALIHDRYVIHRENGSLSRVLTYWRVSPEDLDGVKQGIPPSNRDSGPVIYICEHAGTDGRKGVTAAIQELKRRYGGDACWHNGWTAPDRFRYYRRTR